MKQKIRKNLKQTPRISAGKNKVDRQITSYDTSNPETATPQKVREGNESSGEFQRQKSAEGKK